MFHTNKWIKRIREELVTILLSYIIARTRYISMRWWCQLCTWPTGLRYLDFYSGISLKQQSDVDISLHLDTLSWYYETTILSSYFSMLLAKRISSNYQFYSLWFDPTAELELPIYCTRDEHTNLTTTYAIPFLLCIWYKKLLYLFSNITRTHWDSIFLLNISVVARLGI